MRNLTAFLLSFLISCVNQSYKKDEKHVAKDTSRIIQTRVVQTDPIEERECVDFNEDMLKDTGHLRNYIIQLFPKDFEGISMNDIQSIKHDTSAIIDNYGSSELYIINVTSDKLASVLSHQFYLLVNKEKRNAVLFPFSDMHLIKRRLNDKYYLISGTFRIRSKGYYLIYQYNQNNSFKCVFNSLDSSCNNGIPIYNSSLDCLSYKPFSLELRNVDINNDGLLDLLFSGKALYFCEGLETGYGREDRKPIKEVDLHIQFLANQDQQNLHWRINDSTLCNQLNK